MGGGAYDYEAHKELTTSRATLPVEEVFRRRNLDPKMNPFGVQFRESRDSAAHPDSIGIIFALDETGSMGNIPPDLAQRELPSFMQLVLDGNFVKDPQVLFGGIGDALMGEEAPCQVGQFESEAGLMDQWLTALYLERLGGGNIGESYDLFLYWAARHTSMDCFEKRGRKGYLFVTGDEPIFSTVSAAAVKRYIGDEIARDIPIKEIIAEVSKTFHVFYLIPDRQRAGSCERPWKNVLGDRVITMETYKDTCAVAATLIGITEGTVTLDELPAKLTSLGKGDQANSVFRAVEAYAASIGKGGESRPVEGDDAAPPIRRGKKGPGRV